MESAQVKQRSQKGMTLVELIVVMVAVGTLAGFVGNMIYYQVNTYRVIVARKTGMQDSRYAVSRLSRDLRQIVAADSIYQASADSIRFQDVNSSTVSYQYTSGQILRNDALLASGLTSFKFVYFNNDGDELQLPIIDFADIRSIAINMTILVNAKPLATSIKVTPRNF